MEGGKVGRLGRLWRREGEKRDRIPAALSLFKNIFEIH